MVALAIMDDKSVELDLSNVKFWLTISLGVFRDYSRNKKVLLRERKRHTARHAASTPYVVLSLLTHPPPGWT